MQVAMSSTRILTLRYRASLHGKGIVWHRVLSLRCAARQRERAIIGREEDLSLVALGLRGKGTWKAEKKEGGGCDPLRIG